MFPVIVKYMLLLLGGGGGATCIKGMCKWSVSLDYWPFCRTWANYVWSVWLCVLCKDGHKIDYPPIGVVRLPRRT